MQEQPKVDAYANSNSLLSFFITRDIAIIAPNGAGARAIKTTTSKPDIVNIEAWCETKDLIQYLWEHCKQGNVLVNVRLVYSRLENGPISKPDEAPIPTPAPLLVTKPPITNIQILNKQGKEACIAAKLANQGIRCC